MRPSSTAHRYAGAAFEVAGESGATEDWLSQLRQARDRLGEKRTAMYFHDPSVPRDQKMALLTQAFADFRPEVLNLLRMLAVRTRLGLLPSIVQEFEALDQQAKGISEAEVTAARPLTAEEQAEIARRLGVATGKSVQVHTVVDPSIIGGVVIRIGDRVIDATVAGRLERLRHELAV